MQVHSNATTTVRVREALRDSSSSYRVLSARHQVSLSTVNRWRSRETSNDRSSRPKTYSPALDEAAQAAALILRRQGLTLDECMDALCERWTFSRSSLARFFVKMGLGNLRASKEPHGVFKTYKPGFLHVDGTYLPAIKGQTRLVFVAIDRATRLAFIGFASNKSAQTAVNFMKAAAEFFPFKIHRVLTDNGTEFTNRTFRRWKNATHKWHPFEQLLKEMGISHRFTRPYTPKTNGMVERFNRLAKDATLGKRRYNEHEVLKNDLIDWIEIYNQHRKHSGIGRKTPLQELQKWYQTEPDLFNKEPASLNPNAFATL